MNNDNMITFMDVMLYAMEGESPFKAIENQERRGQQAVVKNNRLPIRTNGGIPDEYRFKGITNKMEYEEKQSIADKNIAEYTKQQYERMGIKIISKYDDLFYSVELPDGWKIKATGHSMWNDLFDDKGRKRANFFYKAAFYDRDAFIDFDTRFHVGVDHVVDASSDYEVWKNSDYQGTVKDGEEIIFSTECVSATGDYWEDDKVKDSLREQLEKYMNEHYPNYKDVNSYWD